MASLKEDSPKPSTSNAPPRDEEASFKPVPSSNNTKRRRLTDQQTDEDSNSSATSTPKKSSRLRAPSEERLSESEAANVSPDKASRTAADEETDAFVDSGPVEGPSAESRAAEERRMRALISHFQEDQLSRFEMYRRATFPKAGIRRLMQSVASCSISQNVVIAMSGISKVFVGEIIEEALDFKESLKEEGPLQPRHLREAVRRLRQKELIPHGKPSKNPLL